MFYFGKRKRCSITPFLEGELKGVEGESDLCPPWIGRVNRGWAACLPCVLAYRACLGLPLGGCLRAGGEAGFHCKAGGRLKRVLYLDLSVGNRLAYSS